MKKHRGIVCVASILATFWLAHSASLAQLRVLTVPFVASNPAIPHDTYNGVPTTFKAIARNGTGNYDYAWDFNGDGVYDYFNSTTNSYDLSATYSYPAQASDRLFIARIRVTSGPDTVTAEYRVLIHEPATRAVKVNRAIDDALWFLHVRMQRGASGGIEYGSDPGGTLGATGMAAQAWAIQGHKVNGDYDSNPYVEDVRRALNFCLFYTASYSIAAQPAGDPDVNGNGIGLYSAQMSVLYETGIVLMALANSGDSSVVAAPGFSDPAVAGRTYGAIVQDMVDFLAFAQNESSVYRGGWRYGPNYGSSDMSVTQWPVIGLEAAETNPDFGPLITVPPWVKSELRDNFLSYDQGADGGFGYVGPGGSNFPRTGAGLACQAWVGLTETDARVTAAVNYLDSHWDWTGYDGNLDSFYAMYAVTKGMRGFTPDLTTIGTRDWYAEYADRLIAQQGAAGGWLDCCWFDFSEDLTTAAGVLILVKEVTQPPPVAVAKAIPREAPPGATITFDHSGSFHLDPGLSLVAFRWDFDDDGVWDFETTARGAKPTWVYNDVIACGDEVVHPVTLEVEDDDVPPKYDRDRESVIIKINLLNHPPVAVGDPSPSEPNYEVSAGGNVLLDASRSYDPDTGVPQTCDPSAPADHIVRWEWDLDNDGVYDVAGERLIFDTPDDWVVGTTHTVQLRVTDDGRWAGPGGGGSKSGETTVTILVIEREETVLLYVGPTTGQYRDSAMLAAVVRDASDLLPIPGLPITLQLGTQSCAAISDGTGRAQCPIVLNQLPGTYPLVASFAGNDHYVGSSDRTTFLIRVENTTVQFLGPTVVFQGQPAVFRAKLLDDGAGIAGRSVTFRLGTLSCVGRTDAGGNASCTILINTTLGPKLLQLSFGGDAYFLASSINAEVVVSRRR